MFLDVVIRWKHTMVTLYGHHIDKFSYISSRYKKIKQVFLSNIKQALIYVKLR
jgi:hypothetical protein